MPLVSALLCLNRYLRAHAPVAAEPAPPVDHHVNFQPVQAGDGWGYDDRAHRRRFPGRQIMRQRGADTELAQIFSKRPISHQC
jgi:hypothetical protein